MIRWKLILGKITSDLGSELWSSVLSKLTYIRFCFSFWHFDLNFPLAWILCSLYIAMHGLELSVTCAPRFASGVLDRGLRWPSLTQDVNYAKVEFSPHRNSRTQYTGSLEYKASIWSIAGIFYIYIMPVYIVKVTSKYLTIQIRYHLIISLIS